MSKLDDILKEYRETCFLVRDNIANDKEKAIDLLACQNILSKKQVKDLFLDLIGTGSIDYDPGSDAAKFQADLRQKVDSL